MLLYRLKFLVIILAVVYPQCSFAQKVKIETLLEQGNRLLNNTDNAQSRAKYDSAFILAKEGNFSHYQILSHYKSGYSYLQQDMAFLALAHFSDLLMSNSPATAADSALYALASLEEMAITRVAIVYPEKYYQLIRDFSSTFQFLKGSELRRKVFLCGEIEFHQLNYEQARLHYRKALEINSTDTYLEEMLWFKLSLVYTKLYDTDRARECLDFLLSRKSKFLNQSKIYYNAGMLQYNNQQFTEAIKYLQNGLLFTLDPNARISMLLILGHSYMELKNSSKAKSYYNRAMQELNKKGVLQEYKLSVLNSFGWYYSEMNDADSLLYYYKNASGFALEDNSLAEYQAYTVKGLNEYYLANGMYQKSLATIENFLYARNSENYHYLQKLNIQLLNQILADEATANFKLWMEDSEKIKPLLNSYKLINQVVRNTVKSYNALTEDKTKLVYLSHLRFYLDGAYTIGYELFSTTGEKKYLEELIHLSELNKAIVLKANSQRTQAIKLVDMPESLRSFESDLRKKIIRLEYYLGGQKETPLDSLLSNEIRIQLTILRTRYDSLNHILEERFPGILSNKLKERNFDLSQLQESLESNQLVISYFFSNYQGKRLYIQSISQDTLAVSEVKDVEGLGQDILEFRSHLLETHPGYSRETNMDEFVDRSFGIYAIILEPIKKLIGEKRLVILPDAELHLVPFDLLLTQKETTTGKGYKDLPYLMKSCPITYLNTLEQLLVSPGQISRRSTLVGFAPEYSNKLADSNSFSLCPLPGAEEEISYARGFFKGRKFSKTKASKENFFKKAPQGQLLHLALHTEVSDIDPMYSRMYFSGSERDSTNQMFSYELYGRAFNSKLVVLSGCNTGSGNLVTGEGLMNMSRAFFNMGVLNLIVTQWAVADRSSARLMYYYYRALSKGSSSDRALQQAKIDFLNYEDPLFHHPYYWAGYVSLGNPVVYKGLNIRLIGWITPLVFLLLLLLLIRWHLRR
ncbi:MAG: CHAT domain-containing protein [Bacteroidota bacterium]|nr:MAG: CHAT domain-containing protein [Bacteroidota bacterium]